MATAEEKITQMYDAQLASKKAQLQKDHEAAGANLDKVKQENQKITDANLNRTAVEAQKDMMNDAQYYAASGLSSGARAQARLSRSNQLQSDITALRTAQQVSDDEAERQRALLAKEYASAITQAQAENDLAKAQALYEQAEKEEQQRLEERLAREATTQAQIEAQYKQQLEAAKYLAENTGDYRAIAEIYGYTDEQKRALGIDEGPVGETENTTLFRNAVMSPREFANDRSEGKEASYNAYILATMKRWHEAKKISDSELAWLVNYYGV